MTMRFIPLFLLIGFCSHAQDIEVEYDKNRDLSKYKTFSFGEGEVITPKDQQQGNPASLKKLVKSSISEQLMEKGMQQMDSTGKGDLVASFVVGSLARSDYEQLGALGMTPNSSSRTWSRDFNMGSLIIDLHDRSNNLIWRVNATTTINTTNAQSMIDQVVSKGFKKFSLKPKKVKKK